MNGRSTLWAALAVVVLIVVAAAVTATWQNRPREAEPVATSDRRDCGEAYVDQRAGEGRVVDRIVENDPPQPTPGWDAVELKWSRVGRWTFVDDGTGVAGGTRSEGVFEGGSEPMGGPQRLDMRLFDPNVPVGSARRHERLVIIGDTAWLEDAKYQDRLRCSLDLGWDLSLGARPHLYRLRDPNHSDHSAPNISSGATVLAKIISTENIDGETMTTYEQKPVDGYEHVRTRFRLDGDRQLRWAEAVDTTTGKVLYQRTARPDPTHPPIEDPTGQPIVSMDP